MIAVFSDTQLLSGQGLKKMQHKTSLFQGKNVAFDRIIYQKQLGGEFAVSNYLAYRRQNFLAALASVENDGVLAARLSAYANAFSLAEQILRHLAAMNNRN